MASGNPNAVTPGPGGDPEGLWGCGWVWIWFWLFILLIVFAGWGWGGWYGGWGGPWGWWGPRPVYNVPQVNAPNTVPRENAVPREVVVAPSSFLGRTVTVNGKVDQLFGPGVFALAGVQGGHDLLVISKNEKAPALKKGETVQVSGTVEKYEPGPMHHDTGVDVGKVPDDFDGRPAVVASSVSALPPASE